MPSANKAALITNYPIGFPGVGIVVKTKTTSIRQTPSVAFNWSLRAILKSFYCIQTLYKPDTSLRQTVGASSGGVLLREI